MTIVRSDKMYRAEVVPASLAELGRRLAAFFGVGPEHVGTKGDLNHTGGYHRSRRFLQSSPYSRDRYYSVTDAPGNRLGNPDWVCALDISLPPAQLIPMCQRLDRAVRAGQLEKVAEWYGNRDGDSRVDGFNNIRNVVAASDPSHLWHAHLGFIREHAGDNHDDVYAVLTGQEEDIVDQATIKAIADAVWDAAVTSPSMLDPKTGKPEAHGAHEAIINSVSIGERLARVERKLDEALKELRLTGG